MGVFSWFRSRGLSGSRSGGPADISGLPHSLLEQHRERESARTEEIKRAAAADVAAVEEDDKYFSQGDPEDDL
jgi:hypothetical protein